MHRGATGALGALRAVAALEGATLVALTCVAVPLKRLVGLPEGVAVLGPVHGLVYLLFLVTLLEHAVAGLLRPLDVARSFALSVVPFGALVNDRWLRARERALASGTTPASGATS